MNDLDFDDRDEIDECEMRRRGDPVCRTCGSLSARVVRGNECEGCWELSDANRCEARERRAS